jgi:hypothetical protein
MQKNIKLNKITCKKNKFARIKSGNDDDDNDDEIIIITTIIILLLY